MFGVSFSEVFMVGLVALFVVGPQRLPAMLGTMGQWVAKLRRITSQVRDQIGIDDMLRKEGVHGGLNELRSLMRGNLAGALAAGHGASSHVAPRPVSAESREVSDDRTREYPPEGPDAYGAMPDDLIAKKKQTAAPAPHPSSSAVTSQAATTPSTSTTGEPTDPARVATAATQLALPVKGLTAAGFATAPAEPQATAPAIPTPENAPAQPRPLTSRPPPPPSARTPKPDSISPPAASDAPNSKPTDAGALAPDATAHRKSDT